MAKIKIFKGKKLVAEYDTDDFSRVYKIIEDEKGRRGNTKITVENKIVWVKGES